MLVYSGQRRTKKKTNVDSSCLFEQSLVLFGKKNEFYVIILLDKIHKAHTRQYLHNVKAQFNIDGIIRHKNDLTTVMAWVEEMSMLGYNPVLVFKPQGVVSSSACIDDFLLVLQTHFQCDMLKQFGSNAICIDSTHGSNAYHFNLTSIVIVDDCGEGLPVGWMLSNKEDKQMLIQFFRAIKQRVGNISPQWFMTDVPSNTTMHGWRFLERVILEKSYVLGT